MANVWTGETGALCSERLALSCGENWRLFSVWVFGKLEPRDQRGWSFRVITTKGKRKDHCAEHRRGLKTYNSLGSVTRARWPKGVCDCVLRERVMELEPSKKAKRGTTRNVPVAESGHQRNPRLLMGKESECELKTLLQKKKKSTVYKFQAHVLSSFHCTMLSPGWSAVKHNLKRCYMM